MKQFNREYDPYRNFLVNKGPRDPSSAPQAAMDSLGKHLSVLQSMENKNINHAPRTYLPSTAFTLQVYRFHHTGR